MTATAKSHRYHLPKKAIKIDCPQCGPRHRRTLSRYVDNRTGEPLPEPYGRCDRESNCGYSLSPYDKSVSGLSYADEVYQQNQMPPIPKAWFRIAGKWKRNYCAREGIVSGLQNALFGATPEQAEAVARFIFDKVSKPTLPTQPTPAPPTCFIPDEVFRTTVGHYDKNQFARLLITQFGPGKAADLLQRFHIGTSAYWPGACVFWYIDEQGRKRGGQIKLFGSDWHTAKKANGKSKTSWVHSALTYRLEKAGTPLPDWLVKYNQYGECSSCLFGLHQLSDAPIDTPVAIVEAPKTAIICSHYFPGFVWLAVGSLGNLTLSTDAGRDRLAPLRGRSVMLYPDASKDGKAFARWSKVADDLNKTGYRISVSDLLEERANDEQKQAGLDLADFLLCSDPTPEKAPLQPASELPDLPVVVSTIAEQLANPGATLKPDESEITRFAEVVTDGSYPASWDEPNPPGAKPCISATSFHQWQQQHKYYGRHGVASLTPQPPP